MNSQGRPSHIEVSPEHDDADEARFRRDLSEESLEIVDCPSSYQNGGLLRFERRNAADVSARQNGMNGIDSERQAGNRTDIPSTAEREHAEDVLRME